MYQILKNLFYLMGMYLHELFEGTVFSELIAAFISGWFFGAVQVVER